MSEQKCTQNKTMKAIISIVCAVAYFFLTAILFMYLDDLPYSQALFLNMITFTTVGYGIATKYPLVWSFHVLFIIVVVGVVLFSVFELILDQMHKLGGPGTKEESGCCECYKNNTTLIISWIAACALILIFMIVFAVDLDVSWAQAWFMVVQTMTTVGFGDVTPNTGASLWLCIFLGPCLIVAFVACAASTLSLCQSNSFEEKLNQLKLDKTWKQISAEWDMDNDDNLTQAEFVAMFITKMYDISDEDLETIKQGYLDFQAQV